MRGDQHDGGDPGVAHRARVNRGDGTSVGMTNQDGAFDAGLVDESPTAIVAMCSSP